MFRVKERSWYGRDEGGEMGSLNKMASDTRIVVVVRLNFYSGGEIVFVSELWISEVWGSERVGMEIVGSEGEIIGGG